MFINKEDLKALIKECVAEALTAEITLEKHRDEKTGQPLAKVELIKETVFLPAYLCQILPYHEGALRGIQEQTSKESNKINDFDAKLTAIGNIVLQAQESLKCIAKVSDNIKTLGFDNEIKLIEDNDGQSHN